LYDSLLSLSVSFVVSVEELGEAAPGDKFNHCEGPNSVIQEDRGNGIAEVLSQRNLTGSRSGMLPQILLAGASFISFCSWSVA
jgi:hypothetical protein